MHRFASLLSVFLWPCLRYTSKNVCHAVLWFVPCSLQPVPCHARWSVFLQPCFRCTDSTGLLRATHLQLVPCHALHSLLHARFALVWFIKPCLMVLSHQPCHACGYCSSAFSFFFSPPRLALRSVPGGKPWFCLASHPVLSLWPKEKGTALLPGLCKLLDLVGYSRSL